MDFTFLLLIIIILTLTAIAFIWRGRWVHARTEVDRLTTEQQRRDAELESLRSSLEVSRLATAAAEQKLAGLSAEYDTRLTAERERYAEQEARTRQSLADLQTLRTALQTEFSVLAARLLEEKARTFSEHNRTQVDALLHPMRQQLADFRARIETLHTGDTADRAALKAQIEQLRLLNARITDEAHALTRALKGQSQARGAWGELLLERLLESSGLRPDEDYTTQTSHAGEDGRRLRPDIIIRLPDDRHLVIDSKVSLVDYEQAVNLEDAAARAHALKAHAAAVRRHVEELAGKRYDTVAGLNTPDYVLMFVPIEPAFTTALHTDPALYEWAFDRRIILVTAPTLLATLRTVASLWKQDRQTKNAVEIARRGGLLYDKFVGLYQDLESIGVQLERTRRTYDDALGKLRDGRGNLLRQVEELRELGVKTQKNLPASDADS